MIEYFDNIKKVNGVLELCGDKSISHRAVMFGAMAKGESVIFNCANSEDVKTTINCFRQLGAEIIEDKNKIKIKGKGFKGFQKPVTDLYVGNSGTTARLISGILVPQNFELVLTGDDSLSKRPMGRIIDPLQEMGALINGTKSGTLPLTILPSNNFSRIEYTLPVASAQVKSAVLLAGLHLDEKTVVHEPVSTRDHTENLLGLEIEKEGGGLKIYSSIKNYPKPNEYYVPSDLSSASFFIILTLLLKNSVIRINNVTLNKTRTGVLEVLKRMGAKIEIENQITRSNETAGDLVVSSSNLKNITIEKKLVPNIIDEIPILSAAGIFAEGKFRITNAEELRPKESDRIASLCNNYRLLGLDVDEFEDGFEIGGEITNNNVVFSSFGDHRIAMTFAVLSMLLKDGGRVNNFDCAKISNPDFLSQLNSITS